MKRTPFKVRSRPMKRKGRIKKPKAKTLGWWKKEADRLCSLYVRQVFADSDGMVACYTCGKKKHWKEMQCGHFVTRANIATRYDLANLRPQEVGCNYFGGNNVTAIFANKLEAERPGIVAELYKKGAVIVSYRAADYQRIAEEFKERLALIN